MEKNIPNHVAIIMDGNGRWAKKRGLARSFGHMEGAKSLRKALEYFIEIGVKYLTVYAFSTENWNRSEDEVVNGKSIMGLMLLAAEEGRELELIANGPDEDEMLKELVDLIEVKKFNEE